MDRSIDQLIFYPWMKLSYIIWSVNKLFHMQWISWGVCDTINKLNACDMDWMLVVYVQAATKVNQQGDEENEQNKKWINKKKSARDREKEWEREREHQN